MNTQPEGHSPLGGSGAYRWMPCPGSVRVSQGVEDPESEYAALGTAAHALAAHCLLGDYDAWSMIGEWFYDGDHPICARPRGDWPPAAVSSTYCSPWGVAPPRRTGRRSSSIRSLPS